MGPTQSPYILQLFMGPSYFWRRLTPWLFLISHNVSNRYHWSVLRSRGSTCGTSLSRSVGIRRQTTRCTCLTRCLVFLRIHAVLSLRHQETGTDVEVAARLHEVSTPGLARGVSLWVQAGVSRHLFGRYSRLCHHNRRQWAPWGPSCQ